ncbi:MAG: endonuclease III [Deltaproteobacteria bacterium]|nr:endonuclease III [Deltaproteobacteria bacterium]
MKPETIQEKKRRIQAIAERLAGSFPNIRVPLHHRNHYELLVATILSAQCTDEAVNQATPGLFRRYPTPERLSRAAGRDIEKLIRRLGLFRSKARSLKKCAERLVKTYNGEVPSTMEELTGLAGVGRKTANVILGNAFGVPGIVVDTHCKRLSRRLGLTGEQEPEKIERDLMRLLPSELWSGFSHRLIFHGRKTCHARKPDCPSCNLSDLCPSAKW